MFSSQYDGLEFNIAPSSLSSLGITMSVSPPSDGHLWGLERPGKMNHTGILGELQRGTSQVAWANLYINPRRSKYMGFTDWYATSPVCVLVPGPRPYPKILGLVMPFDGTTWLYVRYFLGY